MHKPQHKTAAAMAMATNNISLTHSSVLMLSCIVFYTLYPLGSLFKKTSSQLIPFLRAKTITIETKTISFSMCVCIYLVFWANRDFEVTFKFSYLDFNSKYSEIVLYLDKQYQIKCQPFEFLNLFKLSTLIIISYNFFFRFVCSFFFLNLGIHVKSNFIVLI